MASRFARFFSNAHCSDYALAKVAVKFVLKRSGSAVSNSLRFVAYLFHITIDVILYMNHLIIAHLTRMIMFIALT